MPREPPIPLVGQLPLAYKEIDEMKPIILMTGGLENTARGLHQLHVYENYGSSIVQGGGIPVTPCTTETSSLEQLADSAHGLFLTGGEDVAPGYYGQTNKGLCGITDSWRDQLEFELCKLFVQRKKPILGICRGLQILNVYFQGTLTQDLEHDKGIVHPYHSVHNVETTENSWLKKNFGTTFQVNSYHHQAVDRLGEGLIPTAFANKGQIIEGIKHQELPILAVQWHPERMTGTTRFDESGPNMAAFFSYFCEICRERSTNESYF